MCDIVRLARISGECVDVPLTSESHRDAVSSQPLFAACIREETSPSIAEGMILVIAKTIYGRVLRMGARGFPTRHGGIWYIGRLHTCEAGCRDGPG